MNGKEALKILAKAIHNMNCDDVIMNAKSQILRLYPNIEFVSLDNAKYEGLNKMVVNIIGATKDNTYYFNCYYNIDIYFDNDVAKLKRFDLITIDRDIIFT